MCYRVFQVKKIKLALLPQTYLIFLETYKNLKVLISELKIHLTRQTENGQIPPYNFFITLYFKIKSVFLQPHDLVHFKSPCSQVNNRVFLQVPSSQKTQRNQTIEPSWGLYCLAVLFLLLYVICASVTTEGAQQEVLPG